ncbi:MAG: ATPase [Clostridiales bacterium]|nr:ATPase [Clostridiales bacterium]
MPDKILTGRESLGIEFGSTRIKAVLVDEQCNPIASGSHNWENRLENGIWTYHMQDVFLGLQDAYNKLNADVESKFGAKIKCLASIGISAMMHGYMPFDDNWNQLAEFRTWRNTITAEAASKLTKEFNFNIPQRWSIAHLYQAILNGEEHIKDIAHITTLAGYVHFCLSGKNVLGVGEASGMFPIDSALNSYNEEMLDKFSSLDDVKKYDWDIRSILPQVLTAGGNAGNLTEKGASLLDTSGNLQPGAVMCPPEGDAGTGMTATNSVAQRTGNISAGTSVFSMVVLENQLSQVYEEIDMVTTPTGKPVAMVHCNNCCTDLDYWVNIFAQYSKLCNNDISKPQIYDMLYNCALDANKDCGGIVSYNYFSGEPVTKMPAGRPLFARTENCSFTLSNFFRSLIYSALATLSIGMEILEKENVRIDRLTGHGGLYKTPYVGQKLTAAAMNTPVAVLDTAAEGGAWGVAVLARYAVDNSRETLEEYLDKKVFTGLKTTVVEPDAQDVDGFKKYMKIYKSGLSVEKSAVENLNKE